MGACVRFDNNASITQVSPHQISDRLFVVDLNISACQIMGVARDVDSLWNRYPLLPELDEGSKLAEAYGLDPQWVQDVFSVTFEDASSVKAAVLTLSAVENSGYIFDEGDVVTTSTLKVENAVSDQNGDLSKGNIFEVDAHVSCCDLYSFLICLRKLVNDSQAQCVYSSDAELCAYRIARSATKLRQHRIRSLEVNGVYY